MASRAESEAVLRASNLRLMPRRAGIRHLLSELYTRSAETEILITDWEYHQRYYPANVEEIARRADLRGVPASAKPTSASRAPAPANRAQAAVVPAPSDAKNRVADRVLLRMIDAPLTVGEETKSLPAAVALLGDNSSADALAGYLAARGVKVHRLPVDGDAQAACAALEAVWHESPVRCLMLLTARDADAGRLDDRASVACRVERGVRMPYWVTRRWFQLASEQAGAEPATLVAITSLGGAFGFAGAVPSPESGALTGLLKSIFVEDARYDHSRFCLKAIDLPADESGPQFAEAVCRELASGRPEVEVAWARGRRRVTATMRQAVETLPLAELPRGGTWVVTGGARGITAAAALELGRRYGIKLHLLGKSPAPQPDAPWRNASPEELKAIKAAVVRKATLEGRSPNDDWERVRKDREIQESLAAFSAAGVTATYHACDVADWDELNRVLEAIRAQDGPLEGILHGAGYAKSFRFGTGPADKVERTMAPKLDGTLALMNLTRNDPLRFFVAFGSLSGRFGGNGLSDYAAANDMLAKLCGWFRQQRPDCHTTCFHWQTWDRIGMAMMADGVGITKNAFKMDFIPPHEGVDHLLDELCAGTPESEVLISDGFFQSVFYQAEYNIPAVDITNAEWAAVATPREFMDARPATVVARPSTGAPLLADWQPTPAGGGIAEIFFDPVQDPFLTQHRLKQRPFLPGVIGCESLAEAAWCARGRQPVHELLRVRIANGLAFPGESPIAARVTVTPSEDGLACRLTTELRDRQGRLIEAARVHAEGVVPATVDAEPIQADPPGRPPLGWFPHDYPDDGLMFHGEAFRCLKEVAYQYDGGWGKIVAPALAELAGERGDQGWILPAAVLDACVVACGGFAYLQFGGVLEVPHAFERLRWSSMPRLEETCIVRFFFRERGERHSRFDFTLYGDDDRPLLEATGYRTVRIGAGGR